MIEGLNLASLMDTRRDPVRWFAIFFAGFFLISFTAQYFYVKSQMRSALLASMDEDAALISRELDYRGTPNLKQYERASVESANRFVIDADGTLIDAAIAHALPGLLPRVALPEAASGAREKPTLFTDKYGRAWLLSAHPLQGGTLVLGMLRPDLSRQPEPRLRAAAQRFGNSVTSAAQVLRAAVDESIQFAVVNDAGELLVISGPLPLRTAANFATAIKKGSEERPFAARKFLIAHRPLTDASRRIVGTIIIAEDASFDRRALNHLIVFDCALGLASWLAMFLLLRRYRDDHEVEKRLIKKAFQSYFSPQIMEAILKEPDNLRLGGHRAEVTVLFSDIRAFTALSESLAPEQLTHLLQEYFTEMTEEIIATDGIVDKFIGDAIMAFWGAPIPQPDQADRAVRTARNMIKRLEILKQKWASEGYPAIDIGIGINFGIATVGNMGSAKRFDYTVIGDAVNAASRLEGLNKQFSSNIIISESTRNRLSEPVGVIDDLGDVEVRGKAEPMRIFRVGA